jgi:hypothetical protein
MVKKKTHTEPLMEYCEFFETEDEAIAHCREVNRGLTSKDPTPFGINADGGEGNNFDLSGGSVFIVVSDDLFFKSSC